MFNTMTLTQAELKARLHYDPKTGVFTWRTSKYVKMIGKEAGCVSKSTGYRVVVLFGKQYLMHRLAFLYMTGEFPDVTDHIDGCRTNNRWANLRSISRAQNRENLTHAQKSKRSPKLLGVYQTREGRYVGRISRGGVSHYCGSWPTPREAQLAVLLRRLELDCPPEYSLGMRG